MTDPVMAILHALITALLLWVVKELKVLSNVVAKIVQKIGGVEKE